MIRVAIGLGASYLGSVNYYRNLLNAIYALPDRGIEPVLLLGRSAGDTIVVDLPPVEVVRSTWLDQPGSRWLVRKLWQQVLGSDPLLERFLISHDIDVLSHSDFLGRRAHIPAICWIGDFQHRQQPQYFKWWERRYRDRDFRLQCRNATRIIVSSMDAQRALASFEPAFVHKSRVLHFVAQLDTRGERTGLETLQERYRFAGPYFHLPNQFWAHKNHRLVLEALAILKKHGEDVLVIATGATDDYRQPRYFGELMSEAGTLGVLDSFRTLGVVPWGDLVGLMANSIAMINPSRAEGWSTSVEEAKSLGKRIILSDLPVHREQAPPDGVFIDPDDPIGLADAMRSALTGFDAAAEGERAARAKGDLPGRVLAFAEAYQQIVLEAVSAPARSGEADER
jgi:glycosyltransferase involved in cell wall biosynthesis